MEISGKARLGLGQVLVLGAALFLLEVLAQTRVVGRFTLPPLEEISGALYDLLTNPAVAPGGFFPHLAASLYEIAVAFSIVCVTALPFGLLLASRLHVRELWEPLVLTFYAVPSVILYPIIFFVLGIGINSKIAMGAMVGFLPVLVNSMSALANVDKALLKMASSVGASPRQRWVKVVFPAAAPILVAGLQLGLSYTLIGVIFAEVVASALGIGFLVSWADTTLQVSHVYANIFVVVGIGVLINLLLGFLERRLRGRVKTV